VLVLRRKDPGRHRPFRTPAVAIIAPLAIIGCIGLYLNLPVIAQMVLIGWGAVGLLIYFGYSRGRSHVGRGIIEVPELSPDAPPNVGIPPMPGAPAPGSPEERG
jgi:APA family basic amino acid/polyamine antiporter